MGGQKRELANQKRTHMWKTTKEETQGPEEPLGHHLVPLSDRVLVHSVPVRKEQWTFDYLKSEHAHYGDPRRKERQGQAKRLFE